MMFLFHSFSHQVCYLKLPKKSEGSANVQWSPFGSQVFSLLRPKTSRVFSVKNHKTSFFLKICRSTFGCSHDVQFSHLQSLVPCFIATDEIWTQTNWRISDLNPSIFQVLYPHVRDMHLPIPTGATRGCWGVSKHERRPAWPPVTAPTEKNKHVGSCLRIWLGWWWKDVFENIMKKKQLTHNSEFVEWRYFQKFSTFWVFFYLWVFFVEKKELSCPFYIRRLQEMWRKRWVFLFWLAKRIKCLLKILGMDQENGWVFSSISYGSVVVETLSGRLFFQLDAMGYNRCEDILGGRFLFKTGMSQSIWSPKD